jgi:hypothetical protein
MDSPRADDRLVEQGGQAKAITCKVTNCSRQLLVVIRRVTQTSEPGETELSIARMWVYEKAISWQLIE